MTFLSESYKKRIQELAGIEGFLESDSHWPKIMTPSETFEYINDLHNDGWEQTDYEDWPWIKEHDHFELKWIDLDDASVKWNNKPGIYSKLTTEYPPIVIASDGYIMDGMHRSSSARQRGDSKILAYLGVK